MARIVIETKSNGRRVISESNSWLYAHLYGQDSISNKAISVSISRKNLPLEQSISPSGCISYRIRRKDAKELLEISESGRYILASSALRKQVCLLDTDDFYYLHKEWSPVLPE